MPARAIEQGPWPGDLQQPAPSLYPGPDRLHPAWVVEDSAPEAALKARCRVSRSILPAARFIRVAGWQKISARKPCRFLTQSAVALPPAILPGSSTMTTLLEVGHLSKKFVSGGGPFRPCAIHARCQRCLVSICAGRVDRRGWRNRMRQVHPRPPHPAVDRANRRQCAV